MATLEELAAVKTEVEKTDIFTKLTVEEADTKIKYRGLDKRSQQDFDWLKQMYPKKILKARQMIAESKGDELTYWTEKEARLVDKYACTLKEEALRKDELVTRDFTHDAADYYIDYDNGDDANNGLSTGAAYKTITKYTTTEVRLPGDRAFLRAGITWDQGTEAVDISFDEDGTEENTISIIGCDSVTNDPWSDSSDVQPIIDFQTGTYQVASIAADYWTIQNFEIKNGADLNGQLYLTGCYGWNLNDIKYHSGSGSASVEGFWIRESSNIIVDGCESYDTYGITNQITASNNVIFRNCTFNYGTGVGSPAVFSTSNTTLYIEDCTAGLTTQYSSYIILARNSSNIYVRNLSYATSGGTVYDVRELSKVFIEDDDGVYGVHAQYLHNGVILKDTTTVRSGGASSSLKITPDSDLVLSHPIETGDTMTGFAKLWLGTGSQTISVYATPDAAWSSALTSSECYIKVSYLSNGSTAARTVAYSSTTIDNTAPGSGWTAMQVTINPLQAGFIYVWFCIGKYEASRSVYVDPLPVVS